MLYVTSYVRNPAGESSDGIEIDLHESTQDWSIVRDLDSLIGAWKDTEGEDFDWSEWEVEIWNPDTTDSDEFYCSVSFDGLVRWS